MPSTASASARTRQSSPQLKKAFERRPGRRRKNTSSPTSSPRSPKQNGAVGINASTGEDSTQYFWSMPSNRLELWAYLESQRIGHPVEREFYKERDVVQEERRMRIDSSPIGRMVEQFLATAYVAHPYGRPGVGWESEISQVTATEAEAFHKKYYVPSNIVIAVVGDVKASTAMPILERYFAPIPAGPKPEPMTTIEPPQFAEKSVVIREATQPFYIEGYHRPDYRDPDDAVYDAITDIFSNGRTARLYRSLVRDQQIAAEAEGFSGFPGDKYPRPLRRLRRSPPRPHARRDARRHPQRARPAEERQTSPTTSSPASRPAPGPTCCAASPTTKASPTSSPNTRPATATGASSSASSTASTPSTKPTSAASPTRSSSPATAPARRSTSSPRNEIRSHPDCQRLNACPSASRRCEMKRHLDNTSCRHSSHGCARYCTVSGAAQTAAAKPAATAKPAAAQPWKKIPIPPLHAFKPEQPKRIELANGLVIFLQEDHELPFINGTILIRGGSRDEPADKVGLVSLYGETWRTSGTATIDGDKLDDELENKAASIETGGGTRHHVRQLVEPQGRLRHRLRRDHGSAAASRPSRPTSCYLAKRQMDTGISRRNDDASDIATREAVKLVYGPTNPYARQAEYATVDAVTLDDLKAWHDKTVVPNGMIVAVSGDFDSAAMEAKLRAAFEPLPARRHSSRPANVTSPTPAAASTSPKRPTSTNPTSSSSASAPSAATPTTTRSAS